MNLALQANLLIKSNGNDKYQITQDELMEYVTYDKETGISRWNNYKNKVKGTICGSLSNGYVSIGINGKNYFAHRLVFIYEDNYVYRKGEVVDHLNGIKNDNRIANLRICSQKENKNNSKMNKNNTTGYTGVTIVKRYKSKYRASIVLDGKLKVIGQYKTAERASNAYQREAKKIRGDNFLYDKKDINEFVDQSKIEKLLELFNELNEHERAIFTSSIHYPQP